MPYEVRSAIGFPIRAGIKTREAAENIVKRLKQDSGSRYTIHYYDSPKTGTYLFFR